MKKNKSSWLFRSFKRAFKSYYVTIVFFTAVIIAWQFLVTQFNVPELIMPSPLALYDTFIKIQPYLLKHVLTTLEEIIIGFSLGAIIGFLVGIAIFYSKLLRDILYPTAILVKVTPIVAIAPLLTIWFGFGMLSKIVAVAIITFFPLIVNTYVGLAEVDPSLIDLLNSLSAKERQIFFKIRIFAALPYIFAALKIGATASIIGAAVSEFVGSQAGLGHLIMVALTWLETPQVFLMVILLAVLGLSLFGLVSFLEKKIVPWKKTAEIST